MAAPIVQAKTLRAAPARPSSDRLGASKGTPLPAVVGRGGGIKFGAGLGPWLGDGAVNDVGCSRDPIRMKALSRRQGE